MVPLTTPPAPTENSNEGAMVPRFGDQLRRYRLAAALSQEVLAQRADLSPRGISDLEGGLRRRPQRKTVRRLITRSTSMPARQRSSKRRSIGTAARAVRPGEAPAGPLQATAYLPG